MSYGPSRLQVSDASAHRHNPYKDGREEKKTEEKEYAITVNGRTRSYGSDVLLIPFFEARFTRHARETDKDLPTCDLGTQHPSITHGTIAALVEMYRNGKVIPADLMFNQFIAVLRLAEYLACKDDFPEAAITEFLENSNLHSRTDLEQEIEVGCLTGVLRRSIAV